MIFPTLFLAMLGLADPVIEWHPDIDAARELARKEDRPLLLVFR